MLHTYLDHSAMMAMDRMRREVEFYRPQETNEAAVQETRSVRKVTVGQRLRRLFTRRAPKPADRVQPVPH